MTDSNVIAAVTRPLPRFDYKAIDDARDKALAELREKINAAGWQQGDYTVSIAFAETTEEFENNTRVLRLEAVRR